MLCMGLVFSKQTQELGNFGHQIRIEILQMSEIDSGHENMEFRKQRIKRGFIIRKST